MVSLRNSGPTARVQLGIGFNNGGPLQLFVQGQGPPRAWTLSSHVLTSSGQQVSSSKLSAFMHLHCPNVGPPPVPKPGALQGGDGGRNVDAARACLAQVAKTFHVVVSYQPASRYWAFQWLETGIFVALALLAAAACYWWVTRRAV